jgi:hypothetical protein
VAATPLVVSLWRRKDKQGFLCSGLLLTGRHILTVKHAFDTGTENDSVYVRLIDGVDGDIEAKVVQRHRDRDAAILELGTAVVAIGPDLLTHGGRSFDGQPATIRVVDPDNFGRATFSNYSIGRFDHETGEYILAPEDALGHSGGIVEVDDRIVALLSRRKKDGPYAARWPCTFCGPGSRVSSDRLEPKREVRSRCGPWASRRRPTRLWWRRCGLVSATG